MSEFGKIRIVNLRNLDLEDGEELFLIDRSNKFIGNPYPMKGYGKKERDRVCDLYETWFQEQISNQNQDVLGELRKIYVLLREQKNVALGCWCYPSRCHGETIKAFLEQYTT